MGGFSLCMSKCQEDVIRGAARIPRGAHDSEAYWGRMVEKWALESWRKAGDVTAK